MKLPNGYGSISKLSGKRRNPYVVTISNGWTDEGKQIRKIVGYVATKKDGFQLLANYHDKPFDTDNSKLTFEELYIKWIPFKEKQKLSEKGMLRYTNAYKYYEKLYNIRFIDINLPMLQSIIDSCPYGYAIKSDIKLLYLQLYKYAKLIDLPLQKNVGEYIILPENVQSNAHVPFTNSEIDILWNNSDDDTIKITLLLIYTGIRPNELSKISEIHENYFVTGSKTESGRNRIIPLNSRIIPIFNYIIQNKLNKTPYTTLNDRFKKTMVNLKIKHNLYDCRHTFATRMNNAHANDLCVKKILGHKISDITKGIYTHKDITQLLETVNLVE